jgi:hypothetical protein
MRRYRRPYGMSHHKWHRIRRSRLLWLLYIIAYRPL